MKRLVSVAAIALLTTPAAAQQAPAAWAAARAAFDAYAKVDSTVGGALVIVRDGEIVAEHYYGLAQRYPVVRQANRTTIWHWGSITKTLTAVAFMQFNDGNALLDDPVTMWVPEAARIHNPFGTMDSVTFRMLLSHSSGLPAGTWPWTRGEPWEPFEPMEWAQLVAMMPYMRLGFRPGERYSYSNPAFVYVARAIEEFGLDSWEGQIYKSYLLPLGMTGSYFGHTPRHLMDERSHNYSVGREGVRDNGPDFHPGATIPNGGWNAPITDIARWLHFLAGDPDSTTQAMFDQIADRNTFEVMWHPVVRVNAEEEMGLSFFLRNENGQKLVGHTGTQANFRSFFWLNPATRMAVIGVVNTSSDVDGARSSAGFNEVMRAARRVLH